MFMLDEGIRTTVGTGIAAGGPSNGSQTTLVVAIAGLALGLVVLAVVVRFPWTMRTVSGRTRTPILIPGPDLDVRVQSAPQVIPAHTELKLTAAPGHTAGSTPSSVPGLLATAAVVGAIAWFWRREN